MVELEFQAEGYRYSASFALEGAMPPPLYLGGPALVEEYLTAITDGYADPEGARAPGRTSRWTPSLPQDLAGTPRMAVRTPTA